MKHLSTSRASRSGSNSSMCSTLGTTGPTYAPSSTQGSIRVTFSAWCPTFLFPTSVGGISRINTAGLGTATMASEIDFPYTYVGGTSELLDEILQHPALEALPATV